MNKTSGAWVIPRDWVIGSVFAASLLGAFMVGRFWPSAQAEREVRGPTKASERTVTRRPHPPALQPASPELTQDLAPPSSQDEPGVDAARGQATDQAKPRAVPFNELQHQVQTEVRDPALGRDVEGRLTAALQQARDENRFKGSVQMLRLDCGSKRCALEARASELTDAGALGDSLTLGVGLPRVRRYTVRHDDGSATVSLIAAREGYDLFGNERVLAKVTDLGQSKR